MAAARAVAASLLILSLAAPAGAQVRTEPVTVQPSDWPWPPPDPQSWWDDKRPLPPEAADPLGDRRLRRNERTPQVDNGYDPLLYRLWGLQPLQNQIVRGDEMILEVAVRPANSVRQAIVRVTARRDGKVFVQGRAGLGCCDPGIARRVGFDAEAPAGWAQRLQALRSHPLWAAPRHVRVVEGGDAADALCVDGVSYELTLLVPSQARSVRRACDPAEIGQAADVLEAVLSLALGHEPRFDVLFPSGADFARARRAYESLIAGGGGLNPAPEGRTLPPTFEPPPAEPEDAPPADEEDVEPGSSNPNPSALY
ncbi:MAG: hypothetical protein ACK41C_09635 [Phenylobacterium sp.]|uniref:hypothetical protein n=1 Tax=Phenylobacterium sp. TaxID=1871053 RepID=UPI00391D5A3A